MAEDVIQNVVNSFFDVISPESVISNITFLGLILLALVFGYALGSIISLVIKSISRTRKLEVNLVKYGAVTSELWTSMILFLTEYLKWLIVLMSVDMVFVYYGIIPFISQIFDFLIRLLALIVCTLLGLLSGGVVYKITKDLLINVGLERELGRHHLADTMAGFSVSAIVAFIMKWYIVLIFLTTGLQIFQPVIVVGGSARFVLLDGMQDLTDYVPQAILGFLIILASVILSDFVSEHIKQRDMGFPDVYCFFIEGIIISVGVLLSLPHFGVRNTYFLEYSFIIMVGGISLGIAFAIGLGFKDKVNRFL